MNFIDNNGLDLTYYDIDFFGGPSEKTNHLINDEKINIDWCYFIYQIIYYYVLYLHLIFFCYLHYALFFLILVISKIHVLFGLKVNEDDVCLIYCATTHTILREKRYFLELTLIKANVSTISSITNLVEVSGIVNITLPNGTKFLINNVYILANPDEICSVLKISVEMDIILKLWR